VARSARFHPRRRPAGAARLLVSTLDGLPYGVALIFSVILLSALIDLPLTIYRQFVMKKDSASTA
jgi:hypothetical protein